MSQRASDANPADLHELTFLFTDIEGSTLLIRELGAPYAQVLDDARALIARAVEAHQGRVVDCRADETFSVFTCPRRATAAALAAQRALRRQEWPSGVAVRVRMGLHTGVAAEDDRQDYLGLDVHRAARVASAGHGGQVLLSESTAALAGASVVDLGAYQLNGLGAPERLYQLLDDELPADFPPLRCGPRSDRRGVRVALADDSVLIREGIARVLDDAGMDVVAQAGTAEELLTQIALHEPDVAIVDIRMPPGRGDEGLRAAQEIRRSAPRVGVMLLSQMLEPAYAVELVGDDPAGVGYLLKDRVSNIEQFAAAVQAVAEGGTSLDPELAGAALPI